MLRPLNQLGRQTQVEMSRGNAAPKRTGVFTAVIKKLPAGV
jgi:hypothetical protein